MASFFQFPDSTTLGNDPILRFQISYSAVLHQDQLTQHWYQVVVLALGSTALFLGCVVLAVKSLRQQQRSAIVHGLWLRLRSCFWPFLDLLRRSYESPEVQEKRASKRWTGWMATDLSLKFSDVKSFRMVDPGVADRQSWPSCDMHIVPVPAASLEEAIELLTPPSVPSNPFATPAQSILGSSPSVSYCSRSFLRPSSWRATFCSSRLSSYMGSCASGDIDGISEPPLSVEKSAEIFLGAVDLTDSFSMQETPDDAVQHAAFLKDLRLQLRHDGLVLCLGERNPAAFINDLLQQLRRALVPVVLLADANLPTLDSLDFSRVDGLVLRNANILPNGKRRDFFRAARLRDCMARCKRQRNTRPGFFVGFLELWDVRPSAAVLRRAYKLSDFFGAAIEARPIGRSPNHKTTKETCLTGYDWLKKSEVVWLQKTWMEHSVFSIASKQDENTFQLDVPGLLDVIPSADRLLALHPVPKDVSLIHEQNSPLVQNLDYAAEVPGREDIWQFSSCGALLCSLGCFSLREEIMLGQYNQVLTIQRSLKERSMLQLYGDVEILRVASSLKRLQGQTSYPDLLRQLLDGLGSRLVCVYKGLDSGFTLPDGGGHLWGVSDEVHEGEKRHLDVYISQKANSDTVTLWHVFLAHHGVPRLERFEEETLLSTEKTHDTAVALPSSIRKELEDSTEGELLYLMQQIRLSRTQHPFTVAITKTCKRVLITDTTQKAWNALHSKASLDASTSMQSLLQMRLDYFSRSGSDQLPSIDNLTEFYEILEKQLEGALFRSDRQALNKLTTAVLTPYGHAGSGKAVTPLTDLYALMFFCALRKLAFDNVYLETTDRCPLFLSQPDQAGVFAELWILGSQCQIYFGLMPRPLGEIIYNRYRNYLTQHPPPLEYRNGKEVFTAYSNVEPSVKLEGRGITTGSGYGGSELPGGSPGYKSDEPRGTISLKKAAKDFGALSIFCFPAIIDVVLLTFLGRGLYLTAFMTSDVRLMANYAILTALVMTGGVTGWVGSTGGFYLFSFAFDNMVHFLVQRFSAALMLTSVVALCGFVAFGFHYSWFAAVIFVLYLFALSTFLNLLGMFATMHRADSPFTSGRIAMWKCMPILLVSPILTIFVNGYDLLIYLVVIYVFTFTLLLSFRNLCHEWTGWHTKVPAIKEKDILAWYKKKVPESSEKDSASLATSARAALQLETRNFKRPNRLTALWRKKKVDSFAEKIAESLPYASFLLVKEAGDAELPDMFTTTWLVQLELALGNQRQLIRGLKEHSAFITYRYSHYDLGQNVGLFLGALLDRLINITMSARTPQPVEYINTRSHYGICFGLLYFLCGAVVVDIVLQRCWLYATKLSTERLTGLDDYTRVLNDEDRHRKKRYWTALANLFTLLAMVFGVTTILLWAFVSDYRTIILYFAYISSYTAMLLCQFHRCFTKSPRGHVITVLACCCVGFLVGCILRAVPSTANFRYDFVIGQNTATISAAVGTFLFTECFPNPFKKDKTYRGVDQKGAPEPPPGSAGGGGNGLDCIVKHAPNSCSTVHRANCQILEALCLGVDVNTKWSGLPEDVRRLIVCRVLGKAACITSDVQEWMFEQPRTLAYHDENYESILDSYKELETEIKEPAGVQVDAFSTPTRGVPELTSAYTRGPPSDFAIARIGRATVQAAERIVRWTAIISGAAPDVPRELWYALRNSGLRSWTLWALLKAWKLCWWTKNICAYTFLLAGKKPLGPLLSLVRHGAPRTLQGRTITVNTPFWQVTGFVLHDRDGQLGVVVYDGLHATTPDGQRPVAIAYYDTSYRLRQRQEFRGADKKSIDTVYQYDERDSRRWPISKTTIDSAKRLLTRYDKNGRPISGKVSRGEIDFDFEFLYRKSKEDSEVLKATYTSTSGPSVISISVFWCVRPRTGSNDIKHWIPSEKIQRVIGTLDGKTYDMKWTYKHARKADIEASLIDQHGKRMPCLPPTQIMEDKFGFLKKPKHVSFDHEDLLIYHPLSSIERLSRYKAGCGAEGSGWTKPLSRFGVGEKVVYRRLPTAVLRTALWTLWGKAPYVDAVSACFLDEMILRKEPLLRRYWHLRDSGRLREAADVLDENLEQIIPAIEPSHESSQTCPLLIKSADLSTMGLGKDATQLTARLEDAYNDTESVTSVIFSDNGCWPDNPGGVSNCRRDLVNGHTTIRGHCLAESANDFGLPRYQIERNINTLKVLPLWGLDGKTPYHGVMDNLLQTQVDERINATKIQEDIEGVFIPLLKSFVRGARSKRYTRSDLVEYSNVVLKMSRYFEKCDFNKTWNCDKVWQAWIQAWLIDYNDPNFTSAKDYFEIEQPSMSDFRDALNLYICYFFIYSVELPANCPTVFQSTHHGISSLYGMLLKYRRGATWGVWDHAILWRETCLNISPAQCLLPIPVQAMLLAGVKLACHLAYTHVDIVLPCTSVFNPDWEQDLGTDGGLRGSKKLFARRIDPIVNGIGNMDAFQPVAETRSTLPTTVMLSNVQFIKDVKTAVLAADIIINSYGFSDYRLVIYGAQDRQPSYALETATLINTRGLAGKVVLAGFGSPKEVLKDAWLFMNSSLSEGLPLAIGEAALSGVPIVATEVGATALVLTDPDDIDKRYGEVVPPNDPEALARAQLSILGMLGPWRKYTKDPAEPLPLPYTFTPEDVAWVMKRMYEKADDRRALGLRLREVVLRSFHGHRYLREHEQMYWIQRRRAEVRRAGWKPDWHPQSSAMFGEKITFEYEGQGDTEKEVRPRWQEFDLAKLQKHRRKSVAAQGETLV